MKNQKITTQQLIDLKSKYSSMRWVLVETVKTALLIAIISLIAYLIAAFANAIFNFHISIDLGAISILDGTVIGVTSIGKGVQSFAEGRYPSLMQSGEDNFSSEPTNIRPTSESNVLQPVTMNQGGQQTKSSFEGN